MMDVSEDGQGIFEHRARQRRCRKKCQTLEKDVRSCLHLICRSQLRVSSIVVGPWDFFLSVLHTPDFDLEYFCGKNKPQLCGMFCCCSATDISRTRSPLTELSAEHSKLGPTSRFYIWNSM